MTSRNLFFKLMKEDLKGRLWLLALISLGSLFAFPVAAAFSAGVIERATVYENGLLRYSQTMRTWFAFNNGVTAFCIVMMAVACGFSSFVYLNSRSKVDFYHSLPVRRELLFAVNYVDGILILAVPYLISVLIGGSIVCMNGVSSLVLWPLAMKAFCLNMVYFVLMYTVVVIAALMTGNLAVGVLGTIVFAGYIPLAVALIQGFYSIFFSTYVWDSGMAISDLGSRLSPVAEYMRQIGRYNIAASMLPEALVAMTVTVVLILLGLFLYRRRPSEAAGKAMAFPVTKPVIRILIVLLSGLGLGSFFWSMQESTGWAVFGCLCGTVISHSVIEIIYNYDFKKLFAHKGQLAVCALASVLVLFVFRYDLLGYDSYMPSESQVKSAAVNVNGLNTWTSYGETVQLEDGTYSWSGMAGEDYVYSHMDYQDMTNVLNMAAFGVDYTKHNERTYSEDNTTITICYTMNSGRKIYRSYNVPVNEIQPQLDKLYKDPQFQQGTYPLMAKTADQVAAVRYKESNDFYILNQLTETQKQELLETYQKEFAALTIETMKKEYPIGLIRFTLEQDEVGIRKQRDPYEDPYSYYDYSDGLSSRDYYPVYPSFTGTIRLLRAQNIVAGQDMAKANITSVTIQQYVKDELPAADAYYDGTAEYASSGYNREVVITDPAEIESLKSAMVFDGRRYYDPFYETEELDIQTVVHGKDGEQYVSAVFPRGKVPEFVTKRLEEN